MEPLISTKFDFIPVPSFPLPIVLENTIKPVLDDLEGILYINDKMFIYILTLGEDFRAGFFNRMPYKSEDINLDNELLVNMINKSK